MRILYFLCLVLPLTLCAQDTDHPCCPKESALTITMNVGKGKRLQLSDGSTYAVNPCDQMYSAYWITPFDVSIEEGCDIDYPKKITNLQTQTSVRAKSISLEEFFSPIEPEMKEEDQDNDNDDLSPPPPTTDQKE